MTIEKHYTPKELSKLLGGSVSKWRRVANDIDGTVRVGRTLHVPESALNKYLNSHRIQAREIRLPKDILDRLR